MAGHNLERIRYVGDGKSTYDLWKVCSSSLNVGPTLALSSSTENRFTDSVKTKPKSVDSNEFLFPFFAFRWIQTDPVKTNGKKKKSVKTNGKKIR